MLGNLEAYIDFDDMDDDINNTELNTKYKAQKLSFEIENLLKKS